MQFTKLCGIATCELIFFLQYNIAMPCFRAHVASDAWLQPQTAHYRKPLSCTFHVYFPAAQTQGYNSDNTLSCQVAAVITPPDRAVRHVLYHSMVSSCINIFEQCFLGFNFLMTATMVLTDGSTGIGIGIFEFSW